MNEKNVSQKDSLADYLKEIPNFLSIFLYAIFYYIASPMLIDMGKSTGIKATDLSLIFTFCTVGTLIGQLTSLFFNKKFSKIQILITGHILVIPLIIILSFNSNLIIFYVVYFICGYILGVIWIQANTFVLESKVSNKARMLTILLTMYSIGSLVSPLISSSILIRYGFSWRFSYYVIIFLIAVNILLYFILLGRRKENQISDKAENTGFRDIFTDRKKNTIFLFVVITVIFYTCSEATIGTWAPTFFRLERNLDIQSAGFALTLFWIFFIFGRIIASALASKIKPIRTITGLSITAIITVSIVIFLRNEYSIYTVLSVAGLGYSAIFPLLISMGSTLYDKGKSVLATIVYAASNIGPSIAPFLTKYLSDVNLVLSLGIAAILMGVVLLILIVMQTSISKQH